MTTRQTVWAGLAMIGVALGYSLLLYPTLPDLVPIHWNIHGKPDGWAPKAQAALMCPGLMAVFLGLLLGLPYISPKQFDPAEFLPTWNYVVTLVVGLLGFIHLVSLQSALHPELDMGRFLIVGLFVFFGLLGNVLGKVRRNFWMGIRTPWTLASDRVWNATHRMAARLMTGGSLVGVAATLLGVPPPALFVWLMVLVFVPVGYSFFAYRQGE